MSRARFEISTRLWRGRDPFLDIALDGPRAEANVAADEHPFLIEAIEVLRPRVVVELGAGAGNATIAMARELKTRKINGVVIAVDTFLGGATEWLDENEFDALDHDGGHTDGFPRFGTNVLRAGLGNFVAPLIIDAGSAAVVLGRLGLVPTVVHLDVDRDFDTVFALLTVWWKRLAPGGVIIGGGADSEEVVRAFHWFFAGHPGVDLDVKDGKCRAQKPIGDEDDTTQEGSHVPAQPRKSAESSASAEKAYARAKAPRVAAESEAATTPKFVVAPEVAVAPEVTAAPEAAVAPDVAVSRVQPEAVHVEAANVTFISHPHEGMQEEPEDLEPEIHHHAAYEEPFEQAPQNAEVEAQAAIWPEVVVPDSPTMVAPEPEADNDELGRLTNPGIRIFLPRRRLRITADRRERVGA